MIRAAERPLGGLKAPGEPDLSPLLAHEAFSRSLAERALGELAREPLLGLSADDVAGCRALLAQAWPSGGIPANTLPKDPPRVVSLADATKAAPDFVILRTLPGSVREFRALPEVASVLRQRGIQFDTGLIVGSVTSAGEPAVALCDATGRRVIELPAIG